jgi:hypothetical protein
MLPVLALLVPEKTRSTLELSPHVLVVLVAPQSIVFNQFMFLERAGVSKSEDKEEGRDTHTMTQLLLQMLIRKRNASEMGRPPQFSVKYTCRTFILFFFLREKRKRKTCS